jgi:hypothetical protein
MKLHDLNELHEMQVFVLDSRTATTQNRYPRSAKLPKLTERLQQLHRRIVI